MKKMKYCALALLAIASLASCDDELTDNVQMNVAVQTSDDVQTEGNVVTVKAGSPVVFNFTGAPDNIAFYSGEDGSAYVNKDRTQVDPNDIESSTLHFKLWAQYGKAASAKDVLHMYISDNFPGLNKSDFKADSALVESFAWTDFEPKLVNAKTGEAATLPQAPVANANLATEYTVNLSEYLGKTITFAFHYQGLDNSVNQSRMNFSEFYIVNKMKNGTETTLYANNFGFTPINMMCHHNLSDQRGMTTNREYGTMTNNTSGIWNMVSAGTGSFFIHSSAAKTPLKNSWLVSSNMIVNSCSPDQGQAVKNIGQNINTYTYTYSTPGEYTATFIATNSNYKKESRVIRELTIKVGE